MYHDSICADLHKKTIIYYTDNNLSLYTWHQYKFGEEMCLIVMKTM